MAGAGLGRKRKREQLDCVEVSLESRYLMELGDSRFEVVPLLGSGRPHHFAAQVRSFVAKLERVATDGQTDRQAGRQSRQTDIRDRRASQVCSRVAHAF